MKKRYLVANWKANMTSSETESWFQELADNFPSSQFTSLEKNEIIICPPFTQLANVKELLKLHQLPFAIGAQDIAANDSGAFTGEIPGALLKEFASFCLIGHSERRKYQRETDELLNEKTYMALSSGIIPIFCVQDEHTLIPPGTTLVAYEPVAAIGTGQADTPENATYVAQKIKENHAAIISVLYGGSITSENASFFLNEKEIDGILIGKASLEPKEFSQLLRV